MPKHTERQLNELCLTCVLLPCLSPQFDLELAPCNILELMLIKKEQYGRKLDLVNNV